MLNPSEKGNDAVDGKVGGGAEAVGHVLSTVIYMVGSGESGELVSVPLIQQLPLKFPSAV
jgi:hypothetical protein